VIEDIFEGATREHPKDLTDILFYWDRHERIIASISELEGMVLALHREGTILEIEPGKYIKNETGAIGTTLTAISEELYSKAVKDYHDWWEYYRRNQK
jgi:hypothetical protein